MSFSVAAIRDGVKDRLATISGLRVYDIIPAADLVVPAAVVQPAVIRYQEAMAGGLVELHIRITVLTSNATRTGQDQLDGYLSAGTGQTTSIANVFNTGRTLGGIVADVALLPDFEIDYGVTEVNGFTYWKADLMLRVLADRT